MTGGKSNDHFSSAMFSEVGSDQQNSNVGAFYTQSIGRLYFISFCSPLSFSFVLPRWFLSYLY